MLPPEDSPETGDDHADDPIEAVNAPTLPKVKSMTMSLMVSSSNQRQPNNVTTGKFLKKITHLNCNDKKIQSMSGEF